MGGVFHGAVFHGAFSMGGVFHIVYGKGWQRAKKTHDQKGGAWHGKIKADCTGWQARGGD
jgi:hypothetical protein